LPEGATAPESATKSHQPELTDRHRCYHCGDELEGLAGARKRTVPHRDHFTAVYGIWYRCLACQRILASPAKMEGLMTRCPCCGADVEVPRDYLFREPDEPLDDRWFAFNCLECERRLEAMKTAVGLRGVCSNCLCPVAVPKWGSIPEGVQPRADADPLAALGDGTLRHCPKCGLLKPTRGRECRRCGHADPSPHWRC
jgi:hypothetical protein